MSETPPRHERGADRGDYALTADQIRFFDEHGYVVLRDWIPADLLARLRDAGDAWIAQGLKDNGASEDYKFAERPRLGRTMWRVDYLHNKGYDASLELLGSPAVCGVAESLCGPNFVPTYESMVFKNEGDGAEVPWHQDAVHPRRWRIFNYDLYLDASRKGAGALRVVPGTQKQAQDICRLEDAFGWEPPDVIHVEMDPGDVLLHDVMVVHGSETTGGGAPLRRTIYYEFRAAEEIVHDGPWDRPWIERRMRLLPIGLRRHASAFSLAPQFDWRPDGEFRPPPLGDDAEELRVAHEVHMTGSFCSAGSAPMHEPAAGDRVTA
jgi:ectoine hydroxylase-related dioxygenase (phytanoyl-CoA dioxygenase family)